LLTCCLVFTVPATAYPLASKQQKASSLETQAQRLLARAHELEADGNRDEALAQAEAVAKRFGAESSPALRETVDEALQFKGFAEIRLGRFQAGIDTLKSLRRRWLLLPSASERGDKLQDLDLHAAQELHEATSEIDERQPEQEVNAAFTVLVKTYGSTRDPKVAALVASAMINHAYALSTQHRLQAALQVCKRVYRQFGTMKDPKVFELVNTALANQAGMLLDEHLLHQADPIYEQVLNRTKAAGLDGKDEASIRALRFKGIGLTEMKRYDKALPLLEEALRRLEGDTSPEALERKASTMINKAYALGQAGRHEAAIAEYDLLLDQFGDSDDSAMDINLAIAMVNRGSDLNDLDRHQEAIAAWDGVLQRYGTDGREELQDQMTLACLDKGTALLGMGKDAPALISLDEAAARAAKLGSATSGVRALEAMHSKGNFLAKKHQYPEAIAALQAALDQSPRTGNPDLETARSQSLNSIGYWRILQAKRIWAEQGHSQDVVQRLREALQGLREAEKATRGSEEKPYFLGNMAYSLYLLGRPSESLAPLEACLRQGGEILYKGELEDADIHPCPPDEGFKALVRKTWKKVKAGK
jgi:tetratricopeptide (TPR) repeat protein